MASNVHFSSASDDWATPQEFFDQVASVYGPFDLDVCASPENAKCDRFLTKDDDSLAQAWAGRCWMNPPYGRKIGRWVEKAVSEMQRGGVTVVCLLPARTDTAWWHKWVIPHGHIEFIQGRLKFGGGVNSAPFPSALVVFSAPLNRKNRN